MSELQEVKKTGGLELATFYIGEALCGIDILMIQEINKHVKVTAVPQSPEFVMGVLNLRGRIITVIDLGKKLGLSPLKYNKENRNIIVNAGEEQIGLVVDRNSDVLAADWEEIEKAPANIGGVQGRFFEGIYKTKGSLVGVLKVREVVKPEDQ